jgi:hypothetical protein
MQTVRYVKTSGLLLLAILPISFVGYLLSVDHENLFFLYEWMLVALVIGAGAVALWGAIKATDKLRWVLISVLAFILQFSVLGLFLGPYSVYQMFNVYYAVTALAFCIYIFTLFTVTLYRYIIVLFMVMSSLFTFYMMFLQALWGKGF